jgi:hypothetical protein
VGSSSTASVPLRRRATAAITTLVVLLLGSAALAQDAPGAGGSFTVGNVRFGRLGP